MKKAILFLLCSLALSFSVAAASADAEKRPEAFPSLPDGNGRLILSAKKRPSLEEILSMLPDALDVVSAEGVAKTSVPVSWRCVGGYDGSEYYYYQFSPQWGDDMDLLRNAPYIGVFLTEEEEDSASLLSITQTENERIVYQYLTETMGLNVAASCGVMANLASESWGFNPRNLQNSYEQSLGYTDDAYTEAVDCGEYANFAHDAAGYGICQWTYWSRKEGLLDFARQRGVSIGDLSMQLDYMQSEIPASALQYLRGVPDSAEGAYDAASYFCLRFEKPANAEERAIVRGNLARDAYWPEYAYDGNPERESRLARQNVSDSPVQSNASNGSLPPDANPLYAGGTYYFNLQVSQDLRLKTGVLYLKPPGADAFQTAYSYTANNYFRYTDCAYTLGASAGTLEYYWSLTYADDAVGPARTDTAAADVVSGVSVRFDADGGEVSPRSKLVIPGQPYGSLPLPVYRTKSFDGWYRDDGMKITEDTIVSSVSDHTLCARWFWESAALPGDVNRDGKVTSVDRTLMARYLAGWENMGTALSVQAMDVNGDGRVTSQDRVILSRFLAQWDEYRELPWNR